MRDTDGRIDAHHHFWDPARRRYPWMAGGSFDPIRRPFGPEDLAPQLDAAGIGGSVLVQTVSSLDESIEFLELADSIDFVRGVVAWVDLARSDVAEQLDRLVEARGGSRLVGIRHQVHDEDDARWLCRPDVRRGLAAVGRRGLAYDLLVRARELPAAVETVAAFPTLAFVVDHLAKPRIVDGRDPAWLEWLRRIATFPNVAAKVSGIFTEAEWNSWTPEQLRPFVAVAVDCFGTDRLMFGSDWPVSLLATRSYDEVVSVTDVLLGELSADERADVFGGTARRIYRV